MSLLLALAIFQGAPSAFPAPPSALTHRWLYLQTSLWPDDSMRHTLALLERCAAEGYNGVVLADYKFMRWDDVSGEYRDHWRQLRDTCHRLKLDLIAAVMPMGYSNSLLSRDPNLAEGLPVRNASFIVQDGVLVPCDAVPVVNGGFEDFRHDAPSGWTIADEPGRILFRDTNIVFEGHASLRMQDVARHEPQHRHARVAQPLRLKPFHNYKVSVAVRTQDWLAGDTRIMAIGDSGRILTSELPPLKPTQDWQRRVITFNTLSDSNATLYLGTWAGNTGIIWWDDLRVEPAGFVNVLRREGAPLQITSNYGGVSYQEGIDLEPIRDPLLGMVPWAGDYAAWHEPPKVRILPAGRITEGQRLRASFYHAAVISESQVACCMSEPKVYEILTEQAKQVRQAIAPDGYMMMHDEIRAQGWDDSCTRRHLTGGEMLADNVRRCVDIIQATDPGKPIFVWSDMFDPNHNARKAGFYYLVKGDGPWFNSWKGLPPEVTIINWQMDRHSRRNTLKHFSGLGHRQILAGYYDGAPHMIAAWLDDARGIPGVEGVMYTTWRSNYAHTKAFLDAAK